MKNRQPIYVISPIMTLENRKPVEYEYLLTSLIAVFFVAGFAVAQLW